MEEHLMENGQQFSAFIDPSDKVAVSDGRGNTIYVRAKMSLSVRGKVQRELASYSFDIGEDGQVDQSKAEIRTAPQLQRLAMLKANIVKWEGPAFMQRKPNGQLTNKLVPVSPQAIERLDPDWQLVQDVYDKINELNAAPELTEEGEAVTGDPFSETE